MLKTCVLEVPDVDDVADEPENLLMFVANSHEVHEDITIVDDANRHIASLSDFFNEEEESLCEADY